MYRLFPRRTTCSPGAPAVPIRTGAAARGDKLPACRPKADKRQNGGLLPHPWNPARLGRHSNLAPPQNLGRRFVPVSSSCMAPCLSRRLLRSASPPSFSPSFNSAASWSMAAWSLPLRRLFQRHSRARRAPVRWKRLPTTEGMEYWRMERRMPARPPILHHATTPVRHYSRPSTFRLRPGRVRSILSIFKERAPSRMPAATLFRSFPLCFFALGLNRRG